MKRLGLKLLMLLGLTGCAVHTPEPHIAAQSVVIDVRTEAEWQGGHLEGAILIPQDKIGEGIVTAVKDKQTRVYLYCRSGRRSGLAMDVLKKAGYTDVINLGPMESAAKTLSKPIVK